MNARQRHHAADCPPIVAELMAYTNPDRPACAGVSVHDGNAYASDGHRMFILPAEGVTPGAYMPGYLSPESNALPTPNVYNRVTPAYDTAIVCSVPMRAVRGLRDLVAVTDRHVTIGVHLGNRDLTATLYRKVGSGKKERNVTVVATILQETGGDVGERPLTISARYLLDAIDTLRIPTEPMRVTEPDAIVLRQAEELDAVLIVGSENAGRNGRAVIMPMRV